VPEQKFLLMICNDCAAGTSFLDPQAPLSDNSVVSEVGRTAQYD
jgi:hypothetical protein